MSGLFVRCEHQNESLNHLVTLVAGLPQLLSEINQLSRKLGKFDILIQSVNRKNFVEVFVLHRNLPTVLNCENSWS